MEAFLKDFVHIYSMVLLFDLGRMNEQPRILKWYSD